MPHGRPHPIRPSTALPAEDLASQVMALPATSEPNRNHSPNDLVSTSTPSHVEPI
jgi:hypothetical protein